MAKEDDLVLSALRDTLQALPLDDIEATIRKLIKKGWRKDADRGKAGGEARKKQQEVAIAIRRGFVRMAHARLPKTLQVHSTTDDALLELKRHYRDIVAERQEQYPDHAMFLSGPNFKIKEGTLRGDLYALGLNPTALKQER